MSGFTDQTIRQSDARCSNANFGTYGHECGKPATWTATGRKGIQNFCDKHKEEGDEAQGYELWSPYQPWRYIWLDGKIVVV
jgi:hypothetical protein